jgi:nucleotide-binding universal stress UspA family protein
MSVPTRILVPLDLTPPGEAKLPMAEGYARAFGAEILLLHVMPRLPALTALDARRAARRNADLDNTLDVPSPAEAAARSYLDTIAARLRAAGLRVQSIVREGAIAATVLDVAAREGVGLIILGSNQRPGLSRLMLGDTAQAIVRGAPCPTLLVRPSLESAGAAHAIRSFTDDATRAGLLVPRSIGVRTVAVARIIGSVGKAGELGANFRPARRTTGENQRYDHVRDVSAGNIGNDGISMNPIDLYKLGYGYYVLDGHRRVAAAKELGHDEIEANVTEFVPVDDPEAQRAFAARRAFERATGLTRIGAARPDSYERLLGLIRAWAARHMADVSLAEAAERWYSKIFRPQAKRIRALRLNRYFVGERTADIFVRLADYRRAEGKLRGSKLSWDEAVRSFSGQISGRPPHESQANLESHLATQGLASDGATEVDQGER